MIPFSRNVRLARGSLVLCLALAAVLQATVPLDEFRARRTALRQSLDGGVLLLKGQAEAYDQVYRFQHTETVKIDQCKKVAGEFTLTARTERLKEKSRHETPRRVSA